tara:strand:- start:899 stop:1021 length:123 start_codon:yes stop_codon:yes gene_type:complete
MEPSDKAEIAAAAKESGRSVSSYLRWAALAKARETQEQGK